MTPISESKPVSQTISQEVVAMARYSASAEDLETVLCFLVRQDTNEWPSLIQKPGSDFLVIGQDAQSESQKADKVRGLWAESRMPLPGDPLRYLTTRMVATKWEHLGECIHWLKCWTA